MNRKGVLLIAGAAAGFTVLLVTSARSAETTADPVGLSAFENDAAAVSFGQCPWLASRPMENCGVLILQEALRLMRTTADVAELEKSSGSFHGQTSLAGMAKAARAKGFQAEGVELSQNDLQKLFAASSYQTILYLEPSRHYVLVESVDERGLGIFDPTARHTHDRFSWSLLSRRWKGKAVVLGTSAVSAKLARLSTKVQEATVGGAGCQNCPGPGGPQPEPPCENFIAAACGTTEEPVDLSNGNLFLEFQDVRIPGRGEVGLEFQRTYNAQSFSKLADWEPEEGTGTWVVDNGRYLGAGDRSVSTQSWGDFTLEADVQTSSPGQEAFDTAWINFRWTDENNRYYCLINQSGLVELSKRQNGVPTFIGQTANTAFNPSSWNRIKVVTQGAHIQIFVNNSLQIDYTDPSPILSGKVALESHFAKAYYDNIKVTSGAGTTIQNFNLIDNDFIAGNNWTSSYDWRILTPPCGCAIVVRPDGRKDKFTLSGSTYVAPVLVFDTLTQVGGNWKLKTKHGTAYNFNSSGELTSIVDRNGNTVSLAYTGISATAPAYVEPGPQLLADDFANSTANLNALGRWTDDDGTLSVDTDSAGSHQMTWNASGDYWYSTLASAPAVVDTTVYTSLSFKVKGGAGNERFTIELQDNGQTKGVLSNTYVAVTTAWKTVTIPLTAFSSQGLNLAAIRALSLKFNQSGSGTVYVDDIAFTNPAPTNNPVAYTVRRPTTVTDPSGRTLTLAYGTNGKLSTITDPLSRVTRFTYDTDRNLTQVTDPKNAVRTHVYSGKLMTSYKDRLNNTFTFTYSYNNRVATQTDPLNNTTAFDFQWDVANVTNQAGERTLYNFDFDTAQLLSVTDPLNQLKFWGYGVNQLTNSFTDAMSATVQVTRDSKANVLTRKDPLNNTTTLTYDPNFNRIATSTDALGRVTTHTYDAKGNLTQVKDAANKTTAFTYDPNGNLLTVTDPLGAVTTYTYDTHGNVLTIKDALNNVTTFTYDLGGRVLTVKDALNNTTTHTYDANNSVASVKDALNNTTTYTYDANGNVKQVTRPGSVITKYTYDKLNNTLTVTDPLNKVTTYAYDATDFMHKGISERIRVTDPLNKVTTFAYDAVNRMTGVTDALNRSTQYTYDAAGHITRVTDPRNNAVNYAYDGNARLRTIAYADGKTEGFDYDAVGNLRSRTDQRGILITYAYDSLNRLLTKTYPDAGTATFTYNANGNMLSAANSAGTVSFAYDLLGRISQVTHPNSLTSSYTYDAAGNRKTLAYPGGTTVTYNYDALNRLSSLVDLNAQTASFTYDALSRRTNVSLPNTTNTTYAYNAASYLTSLTTKKGTTTLSSFAYTYDALGNRLTQTANPGNSVSSYTYDAAYQLTQATNPAISYVYDTAGNRTTAQGQSYVTDNMNRYTTIAGVAQAYDLAGNLTNDGTLTRAWDFEGRLTQVTKTGTSVVYTYDALNRRYTKSVNGTVTKFLYDDINVIAETDSANAVQARYLHSLGVDEPLEMKRGSTTSYYAADGLGSITQLTNSSGTVVERYSYDPYGIPTIKNGSGTIIPTSAFGNRFLYTGREWDSETGEYYYRARYYKPQTGRFIAQDPLGQKGGVNLYTYTRNNPVNRVDPLGLRDCDCRTAAPLPSSASACDEYGTETYAGVSLRCFCKCAGDSTWSQQVRGCLACEYAQGTNSIVAHANCYVGEGIINAPWITLTLCYRNCKNWQWVIW